MQKMSPLLINAYKFKTFHGPCPLGPHWSSAPRPRSSVGGPTSSALRVSSHVNTPPPFGPGPKQITVCYLVPSNYRFNQL